MFKIGDRVNSKDDGFVGKSRLVKAGETGIVSRVEDNYIYFIADKDGQEVCRVDKYLSSVEEKKETGYKFKKGDKLIYEGRYIGYYVGKNKNGNHVAEMDKNTPHQVGWSRDRDVPTDYISVAKDKYWFIQEHEDWKKVEESLSSTKMLKKMDEISREVLRGMYSPGIGPQFEANYTRRSAILDTWEHMQEAHLEQWMRLKRGYEGVEKMPKEVEFKKKTKKRRQLL